MAGLGWWFPVYLGFGNTVSSRSSVSLVWSAVWSGLPWLCRLNLVSKGIKATGVSQSRNEQEYSSISLEPSSECWSKYPTAFTCQILVWSNMSYVLLVQSSPASLLHALLLQMIFWSSHVTPSRNLKFVLSHFVSVSP